MRAAIIESLRIELQRFSERRSFWGTDTGRPPVRESTLGLGFELFDRPLKAVHSPTARHCNKLHFPCPFRSGSTARDLTSPGAAQGRRQAPQHGVASPVSFAMSKSSSYRVSSSTPGTYHGIGLGKSYRRYRSQVPHMGPLTPRTLMRSQSLHCIDAKKTECPSSMSTANCARYVQKNKSEFVNLGVATTSRSVRAWPSLSTTGPAHVDEFFDEGGHNRLHQAVLTLATLRY